MADLESEVVRGRKEIMAVLGLGWRKFNQLKDVIPMKYDGYRWRASREELLDWHRRFTSDKAA